MSENARNRSRLATWVCIASVITMVMAMVVACGKQEAEERGAAPARGSASTPAVAVPVPVPAVPQVATWDLDPENSSVAFMSMHVHSKVRGLLPQPSGTVVLDEGTPARSKVDVKIDIKLISTGVEERDTHLKGPEFFDVARYPVATFVSTSVSKSSATAYSVTGDLTLRDVTKPVTLAVTLSPPFNHAGGIRRGAEATAAVDRRAFGIAWDFPGEGSGVVVGDTIELTINTELVLRPAPRDGG